MSNSFRKLLLRTRLKKGKTMVLLNNNLVDLKLYSSRLLYIMSPWESMGKLVGMSEYNHSKISQLMIA